MSTEQFRIGSYFLGQRPNSDKWCACYFDPQSRQTRRSSLGTSDLQEAQVRLAAYVTKHQTMTDAKPEDVPLEVILEPIREV